VIQIIVEYGMIGLFVNNELRRAWEEVGMTKFRYHPCICLESLRKSTKTLSQGSWSPCRDLNLYFPNKKLGAPNIRQQRLGRRQ
jgi:hypothetical protein